MEELMNENKDKTQLDPYDINNPLFLNAIENLDPKRWKVRRVKKKGTPTKVDQHLLRQIALDVVKFRNSGLKWREVKALIKRHHDTEYSVPRLLEIHKKETSSKKENLIDQESEDQQG